VVLGNSIVLREDKNALPRDEVEYDHDVHINVVKHDGVHHVSITLL